MEYKVNDSLTNRDFFSERTQPATASADINSTVEPNANLKIIKAKPVKNQYEVLDLDPRKDLKTRLHETVEYDVNGNGYTTLLDNLDSAFTFVELDETPEK